MKKRARWTMLLTYLISFVLVLVLGSNASAIDWDDGGDPNERWSLPANWAGNVVPGSGATAVINMADANCLIDSSVTAECSTLTVGYDTGPSYLDMTGGTLTTSGNLTVGDEPDSNGIFTISDGNMSIGSSARLWIGLGSDSTGPPAYGYFLMKGGQFTGGAKCELGKNTYGVGTLEIQGGSMDFTGDSSDFEFGTRGNATVVITDGNLIFLDKFRMSDGGGVATVYMDNDANIICNDLIMNDGTPTIYIDGGIFTCTDQIEMLGANALIDITEGELIAETDGELSDIQGYISAEKIIGYGGAGIVDIDPSGGEINVTARMGDPNLAWSPSPGNYATVEWTPAGPTLSWKPGRYAAKHDVYFGTDEDDVNDATDPNTLPGRGRQDPCSCSFPTPPPELGETYYWRIDEVNDACAPYIWKGDVWEFTMADYEEVEDFDSYADDAALEAVWNLTGSNISLEDTIVRSGKSMKYEYYTGNTTEADANTTGPNSLPVDINDWTSTDIKAVTLYFYGDGTNAAEQMYVALEDTDDNLAVVYCDNPHDLNEPEWHEWNIKLSDFYDISGVNLSSIAKVYIGFGNRGSPTTSGGTVYFDDIRLHPTRCVASFAPEGDIDGDCEVDFVDVNTMVGDWLEMDYNDIGSNGVLGVNFPGDNSQWVDDGERGRSLQFDGIDDWVDLDDGDFSNFHDKTIAFWVRIREYPTVYRYMFYFNNGDDDNPYRIYFLTYTEDLVRVRFVEDYSETAIAADEWTHLAFVLRDTDYGLCRGEFYGDGTLYDLMPGQPRHSGGAVGVNLGSSDDGSGGFVNAVYDDFRVYDYALSESEIRYLAESGGTEPDNNRMLLHYDFNETSGYTAVNSSTYEFYHPLLSDAELYEGEAEGSRVVDSKDFAILADSWLEEQLWP